jgi:hypothetical protein
MRSRLIALVLVAGCGLTMTHGPAANRPPTERPQCTESMEAPKRDAYGAIAGFLAILTGLLFYKTGDGKEDLGVGLMVGGAVVTGASYASGGIGYYRVKSCRKAIADFEQARP